LHFRPEHLAPVRVLGEVSGGGLAALARARF